MKIFTLLLSLILSSAAFAQTAPSTSSISSGTISFVMNAPAISGTSLMAGTFPVETGMSAAYGVVTMGSAPISTSGTPIQFQQKPAGASGMISISGTQKALTGSIQLSASTLKDIQTEFGADAKVSSVAVWAVISNTSLDIGAGISEHYNATIAQAFVYIYIDGQSKPVGPIVF